MSRRLTREEECRLVARVRGGDRDALETLVLSHLGFVAKVAAHYAGNGAPAEDLFNEGTLGLIEAARRYEPERGHRFLTYAVFWIRRSVLAALKLYNSPIRIPESRRRRGRRPDAPPAPTVRPMSKPPQAVPFDQTGKHHEDMLGIGPVSLDQQIGPTVRMALGDTIQDCDLPDAEQQLLAREAHREVRRGLLRLSEIEQYVLNGRFGLGGGARLTLEEIGGDLGVTRERVRQIELRARARLRRALKRRRFEERQRRIGMRPVVRDLPGHGL